MFAFFMPMNFMMSARVCDRHHEDIVDRLGSHCRGTQHISSSRAFGRSRPGTLDTLEYQTAEPSAALEVLNLPRKCNIRCIDMH